MVSNGMQLRQVDIVELEKLMFKDGLMQVVDYAVISKFSQEQISLMCHKHAIYQIITTELLDFVKNEIGEASAIEIGAGNGCLGRALGIPLTDSHMQTRPDIALTYKLMGQPPIVYPADILKYDALEAIEKFKPDVVVAAWVTELWDNKKMSGNYWGVDEIKFKGKVKKYILVGSEKVHGDKNILQAFPVKKYKFDWLVTRSLDKGKNVIYVFDCQ